MDDGTNLADVHALLEYVSDGAVSNRSHENDRLSMTLQYANSEHKSIEQVFLLSEFMAYVEDPETGEETDLLYGTLGDYRQPVPPWNKAYPPSVFDFPLTLILSDEISVDVSAPAGLATWQDLQRLAGVMGIRRVDVTIPAEGWAAEAMGAYYARLDLPVEGASSLMIPQLTVLPDGQETAAACGLCPAAEAVSGAIRLWAVKPPEAEIPASLALFRDSSGLVLSPDGGESPPIATKTAPGSVKPGDGMRISSDGTISVETASREEIQDILNAADVE